MTCRKICRTVFIQRTFQLKNSMKTVNLIILVKQNFYRIYVTMVCMFKNSLLKTGIFHERLLQ